MHGLPFWRNPRTAFQCGIWQEWVSQMLSSAKHLSRHLHLPSITSRIVPHLATFTATGLRPGTPVLGVPVAKSAVLTAFPSPSPLPTPSAHPEVRGSSHAFDGIRWDDGGTGRPSAKMDSSGGVSSRYAFSSRGNGGQSETDTQPLHSESSTKAGDESWTAAAGMGKTQGFLRGAINPSGVAGIGRDILKH